MTVIKTRQRHAHQPQASSSAAASVTTASVVKKKLVDDQRRAVAKAVLYLAPRFGNKLAMESLYAAVRGLLGVERSPNALRVCLYQWRKSKKGGEEWAQMQRDAESKGATAYFADMIQREAELNNPVTDLDAQSLLTHGGAAGEPGNAVSTSHSPRAQPTESSKKRRNTPRIRKKAKVVGNGPAQPNETGGDGVMGQGDLDGQNVPNHIGGAGRAKVETPFGGGTDPQTRDGMDYVDGGEDVASNATLHYDVRDGGRHQTQAAGAGTADVTDGDFAADAGVAGQQRPRRNAFARPTSSTPNPTPVQYHFHGPVRLFINHHHNNGEKQEQSGGGPSSDEYSGLW